MQSLSETAELNYKCSIVDQKFDSHNNPVKLLLKGPIMENTNGSLRVTVGDKVQTFIRSYFYKYKCVKTARSHKLSLDDYVHDCPTFTVICFNF